MTDIKTFDIVLFFILAITVSLIIGINVLYVVDKKLSDIKINVPPCPTPNIYIQSANGQNKKIDVSNVEMKSSNNYPSVINNKKIEGFGNIGNIAKSNNDINELPLAVMNVKNGHENQILLRQGYNSSGSDLSNTFSQTKPISSTGDNVNDMVRYPRASDVVRYSDTVCYKGGEPQHIRQLELRNTENQQNKDRPLKRSNVEICNDQVYRSDLNNIKTGFINASGETVAHNIDFYVPNTYMGQDPFMRGVSYANLSIESPADVDQIGSIPVNDYDGEPIPIGALME